MYIRLYHKEPKEHYFRLQIVLRLLTTVGNHTESEHVVIEICGNPLRDSETNEMPSEQSTKLFDFNMAAKSVISFDVQY